MFPSFIGLQRPVKRAKVSCVLSTPGQVIISHSHLDIDMGGHYEGFGGCNCLSLSWKFIIKATDSLRDIMQVVIEDLMLPK